MEKSKAVNLRQGACTICGATFSGTPSRVAAAMDLHHKARHRGAAEKRLTPTELQAVTAQFRAPTGQMPASRIERTDSTLSTAGVVTMINYDVKET